MTRPGGEETSRCAVRCAVERCLASHRRYKYASTRLTWLGVLDLTARWYLPDTCKLLRTQMGLIAWHRSRLILASPLSSADRFKQGRPFVGPLQNILCLPLPS